METLGLSGDILLIENGSVIKICETDQFRFLANIKKQEAFQCPYISAVPIIEAGIRNNKHYIRMPIIKCGGSIDWISKATPDKINDFIIILEQYFRSLIDQSVIGPFDYDAWHSKIVSLESKISDDEVLNALDLLKAMFFYNPFYYGINHGDFTLSNLFISDNGVKINVDAIDFLDVFINSPIHDFVKIRQDTKHFWTIHLMDQSTHIDTIRAILLLSYIDSKIEVIIKNDCILNEYYLPFQILNIIRIFPYNKDAKIASYLKQEIKGLTDAFNANNAVRRA
jgi:hypothetical protein